MVAVLSSGLHKAYNDNHALNGLSLEVHKGDFFGLLGPNGAGKSTFMNIVSGFLRHDSGKLEILSKAYDENSLEQKQSIGLSPQQLALYDELSAEENLQFFGRFYGLSGKALRSRVDEALDRALLQDRRKDLVKTFSGGMKRRLNIAASLLHRPSILLCDEPTVGVDPQSRNSIFDTLQELNRDGMTVIYSTHYMEEAEKLCNRVGIIDKGAILSIGKLKELLDLLPTKQEIVCESYYLNPEHRNQITRFGTLQDKDDQTVLSPNQDFRLSTFYAWVENESLDTQQFQRHYPSLESVFLHLTGRDLRE